MIWLTKEHVIYLHSELINSSGGLDGVRDDNLLQSALLSPLQTYNSKELFPTLVDKAARLACGLVQNHPFIDGNKRIGAQAMLIVLFLNKIPLFYSQNELTDIFMQLAADEISFYELREWINVHIRREET